ncbi:hypothetical protein I3843_10G065900 [Carya illinoinensis]|nr:hypothetical protein I3843_10G065900 [Carya illinoinensis]
MATRKLFSVLFLQFMFVVLLVLDPANAHKELIVGFYEKSCPEAEAIVKKVMVEILSKAPTLAAPLIRLHFHDCFVRGCDGSVLLDSSTKQAEKDFASNLSLRGFQIIDRVKSALEKACPGVVSYQGTILGSRTGRKDGRVSSITEASDNLPPPYANITLLIRIFQGKGLSIKDLVVLSGAHTVGTSHCHSFDYRLYNFTGKLGTTDPKLDPNYIKRLKSKCNKLGDETTLAEMDPRSFKTFDASYYTLVAKRRGLFESDAALLNNTKTKSYVKLQAATGGSTFFDDFGVSMVNMGRIGVLTGKAGEIRKQCSKVNK